MLYTLIIIANTHGFVGQTYASDSECVNHAISLSSKAKAAKEFKIFESWCVISWPTSPVKGLRIYSGDKGFSKNFPKVESAPWASNHELLTDISSLPEL